MGTAAPRSVPMFSPMNSVLVRGVTVVFLAMLLADPCIADDPKLHANETWLKLVNYEPGGNGPGGFLSAAQIGDFFLADDGQSDPESELRATLAALRAPLDGEPNEHAQCRYPARYIWLKKQSALDGVDDISCPDFDAWIYGKETASLSIVFVTGYLGNPASYYGHTLLKFNSPKGEQTSDLLDVTVNYGAIIPPGTGPINYIYNGATGGFSAGFSHIEYYFHDYNYGELELRDLWEYELNLTAEEVRFIVAHAWEVLGHEYVYYFFRKNCAYRMAELVEIVDGIDIIPPRRAWTIPQSVISRGAESDHHGKPLLGNVKRYPSRQSMFYEKFRGLNRAERDLLRNVARSADGQNDETIMNSLPVSARQRVADALIDYYQYLMPKDEPQDSELSKKYRSLLGYRFGLPPAAETPRSTPALGPADDRAPGYLSLGYVHNDALGSGATIRIRPVYYDALDSSVSHVPNSELSMGEVVLEALDGRFLLRQASLFRVESVNGSVSGLPGDNGRSWTLGIGLIEQSPSCDNCLVARFEGDIGRSIPIGSHSAAGVYIGGAVQDNRNDNGNLFIRGSVYWNGAIGQRLRLRARYESRYHVDGKLRFEDVMFVEARVKLSREWDTRLRVQKNVTTEVSLTLGHYW